MDMALLDLTRREQFSQEKGQEGGTRALKNLRSVGVKPGHVTRHLPPPTWPPIPERQLALVGHMVFLSGQDYFNTN